MNWCLILMLFVQVAVCMFIVHLISKLSTSNTGSLSVSLIEKVHMISKKVSIHVNMKGCLYHVHGALQCNIP